MAETTKLCSVEGCVKEVEARDLCPAHYQRWRIRGSEEADVPLRITRSKFEPERDCKIDGCSKPARGRGWCGVHYQRWRKHGDPEAHVPIVELGKVNGLCSIDGCEKPMFCRSWCAMHYDRQMKTGELGPAGTKYPGHGHITETGYRRIPIGGGREAPEHRVKMEALLGRRLGRHETVHHINGDRTDNRTDGPLVVFRSGNLELWSSSHPRGQRVEDKIAWATKLLEQYAPERLK